MEEIKDLNKSKNVSKLGSKEVSKNLRNFTLASKKACHCEDERSEDVAIAKSLNINEITTQSMIARNDKSLSETNLTTYRLNDLASFLDTVFSRFTSHFSRKRVAFTLAEGATHVDTCDGKRKIAFTLAEVLITLGIIGVVASLTLPSVVTNYQKKRTVNKLKSTYSILCNAIQMAKVDYGDDINQWELPDGIDEKASSDYFSEKYLIPYLKIAKDCNPGECLPLDYRKERTFILSNGSIISVRALREYDLRLQITMYINGYKKKMSSARDAFMIELGGGSGSLGLDKNDLLPYGYRVRAPRTEYTTSSDRTSCTVTGRKSKCFALIMYDGWKISDDYPW